ncbi:SDR family oxidoreductase [bacterium SCSIO 12741]|nr:SDR family oxidoreductase [bacterium SCSIO 12741]
MEKHWNKDLKDKTVVFTGGTDGMGKVAAQQLAEMGAKIMLFGRNETKSRQAIQEIRKASGNENIHYVHCDLSSQKSIRSAAQEVLDRCPKIDILVNCAGMNAGERVITEEGMEMSWAVNHLAPFLLNNLLLDRIKASAPARIINLSSAMQKNGHIHLDDIQLTKGWSTLQSYAQAKLAMNMVTRKMARELKGTGVTVNALNPGFIKTNLLHQIKGWEKIIGVPYMHFFASKPEVGAERIVRLAVSDDFEDVNGQFVYESEIRDPNPEALDDDLVEKVWGLSKEHVGL